MKKIGRLAAALLAAALGVAALGGCAGKSGSQETASVTEGTKEKSGVETATETAAPEEAKELRPTVLFVDEKNKGTKITNYEKHGEISK